MPAKVRNIFSVVYGFVFLLFAFPIIVLINVAQTWIGKGFGISAVLLLLIPLLVAAYYWGEEKQKIWLVGSGLMVFLVVGFIVPVIGAAPSGSPGPDSPVQHRFFRDGAFGRFSLANLIPESDQVSWGFVLMELVDPFIDREQASRVAPITMAHYREMEQDENFHELGSVMGLAYGQLFGQNFDAGHYYLYVPENRADGPLPALVFLHGSAGNFKSYTWIWSKFAEQEGFVIIAPSYGFGMWDEAGVDTVFGALEDAKQVVHIDEERIYLAGLSNGGLGISWTAAEYPDSFRGLIFLSPVFETSIVDGTAFQMMWAERPVLVITGEDDRRIPLAYVENRVEQMSNGGINVTTAFVPDEDHFLVFSEPENVTKVVADWIRDQ